MRRGLGYKMTGMGAGDTSGPGVASETLAWLYLRQGDVRRARQMFEHLLVASPGNSEVRCGLERCRRMEHGGGLTMNNSKRLQVLRLLLARFTGQPAPAVEMVEGDAVKESRSLDPAQRRLQLLQEMLQRVRQWRETSWENR